MHENLKRQLMHLLEKDGTPRPARRLAAELGLRAESHWALDEVLDDLGTQGRLLTDARGCVRLPDPGREIAGTFHAHARGFGFVAPPGADGDGEVFIPAKATAGAMSGDHVLVAVSQRRSPRDPDRVTGRVVRILERAHTSVVGTLRRDGDHWSLESDGGVLARPLVLERVDGREVRPGDKVAARIRTYPTRAEPARGLITAILGRAGRYDAEVAAIVRRYGLAEDFDDSSLVEAHNARACFHPGPEAGREDCSDLLTVTIDPPDACDHDDAISLARDAEGDWVLGVHIADVSRYVPAGSALDRGARLRGNSVYLPGRCLPMLPEMLSTGICSLLPGEVRWAKSVFLTYAQDGTLRRSRLANSRIRSDARLSYPQVDAALRGRPGDLAAPVLALLRDAETLARRIEERRRRAGMLSLAVPETEVLLDHEGRARGLQPLDTSYPHTVIEMAMVEANVAVARYLDRHCIPFLRRAHPEPPVASLRQLSRTLHLLGLRLPRRPQRHDLQRILAQVTGTRLAFCANLLILRSLAKAAYTPAAVGHYALAAPCYAHFTSPIRRYADLLLHRVLDDALAGRIEQARRRYSFAHLAEVGEHLSETEQTAEQATTEVKTIFLLHLLADRIGTECPGIVVGLNSAGALVRLPDFGVDGSLRIETLGADQWQYDEAHQCLLGRHSRRVLRLAQSLRVRIAEVSPGAGHLDLVPAQDLAVTTRSDRSRSRRAGRNRGRGRRRPSPR